MIIELYALGETWLKSAAGFDDMSRGRVSSACPPEACAAKTSISMLLVEPIRATLGEACSGGGDSLGLGGGLLG
jgi:hypothetical protein